jgi:hypothetical protein
MEFTILFADNNIDEILFTNTGATVAIIVKPVNTTVGATNPAYTGTGIYEGYQPIAGSVGDFAMTNVTILSAGSILDRDITP